ncbi:hypothetical protein LguiA_002517 [Lonicera macranthoides]
MFEANHHTNKPPMRPQQTRSKVSTQHISYSTYIAYKVNIKTLGTMVFHI